MNELIDIFRMNEVKVKTRIKLIKEMGELINCKYSSNITEPIVVELCLLLDSNCGIEKEDGYKAFVNK